MTVWSTRDNGNGNTTSDLQLFSHLDARSRTDLHTLGAVDLFKWPFFDFRAMETLLMKMVTRNMNWLGKSVQKGDLNDVSY